MLYIDFPSWIKPEIIPGLPIRWYGLMYFIAFAVTYLLFKWQVKKKKLEISDDLILSMFFWTILGLLFMARVFGTLVYAPNNYYWERPWLIFWPFDDGGNFTGFQGMSFHGGLLGAILGAIIFLRIKKQNFTLWADMIIEGVPLGYTFGRLGNFINGELYGKVTASPLGILFPGADRVPVSAPWAKKIAQEINLVPQAGSTVINLPRHPSQLYEAFFEGIVLWLILWFVCRKHKPFLGFSVAVYLMGYSLFRFFVEYVRQPDLGIGVEGKGYVLPWGDGWDTPQVFVSFLNITTGQIFNLLMFAGGVLALFIFREFHRRRPKAETFEILPPLTEDKKKSRRKS